MTNEHIYETETDSQTENRLVGRQWEKEGRIGSLGFVDAN